MSFTRSGGVAPAFSFPIGVGTFTDVNASNAVFTSNVYSSFYSGDGGGLTNVTASIPSTFANLVVSNSVTTTNIFATGNVVIGPTPAAIQANLQVERGDIFIGNSSLAGSGFATTGSVNRLIFDNSGNPLSNGIPNKIVLYSNTISNVYAGISVTGVTAQSADIVYKARFNHYFLTGSVQGSQQMYITSSGAVGIGTNSALARLHVAGVSVTNSNNVQTRIDASNVALVTNGGGLVGINTLTPSANLHVLGNIYATNALTTTNVFSGILSVTGSINYTDDLFKRGPYLPPSTSNAAAIQAWISSTCNNASTQGGNSWWSRSNRPNFSNIVTKGTSGTFAGSVVLNDGRVLFVPYNSSTIGIFNPATNQYSAVTPSGAPTFTVGGDFIGGVLVPDGDVVFIPYNNSNVCIFNPSTYVFSNVIRHGAPTPAFFGGCLDPFGNVVCVPASSTSNIGTFDPVLNTFSNVAKPNAGGGFGGGVTLPNGNIVCIPYTNSNLIQFNPYNGTVSNSLPYDINTVGTVRFRGGVLGPMGNVNCVPSGIVDSNIGVFNPNSGTLSNIVTNTGSQPFQGGCLLPTGRILFAPFNSSNVGLYDPYTLTYSNSTPVGGLASSFGGCSLIRDGRVVFVPNASANVGVVSTLTIPPPEFVMSPFFNKY